MATAEQSEETQEAQLDKGLKSGALGLISTTVIATASVAPAYSIAATLVFVVGAVALQAPAVSVLAFVPMLLTSIGYSELNKADPDCGTTFTWATRAFGPRTGWAGGWAIIVADVLVMASLAQVAGQYGFLLFNAKGIGNNPTSGWVLLVGVLWIVVMTYICYRGIEVSANFQKVLLGIELVMLVVLSVTALVKVGTGSAPPGQAGPVHLRDQRLPLPPPQSGLRRPVPGRVPGQAGRARGMREQPRQRSGQQQASAHRSAPSAGTAGSGTAGRRSQASSRAITAAATAAAHPHSTSAAHQIRRSLPAVTAWPNAAGQAR